MFNICRRRLCFYLMILFVIISSSAVVMLTKQRQKSLPVQSEASYPQFPTSKTSVRLAYPLSRIVHQSWRNDDQLPPRFAAWRASWLSCLPDWQHRLWTDEANLLLVRQKAPEFLDHYLRYTENIQRADSVRYLYLYHYGGLYTDLDNECLQPFEHYLLGKGVNRSIAECGVLLSSMSMSKHRQRPGQRPYIENSLMFARRPGHPFWLTVLEAMAERAHLVGSTVQETVDITTGPQLLMHALERFQSGASADSRHGQVCLLPSKLFNPFSWDPGAVNSQGPCRDLNRMTDAQLADCRKQHRVTAFVLQYHTQSWGHGRV